MKAQRSWYLRVPGVLSLRCSLRFLSVQPTVGLTLDRMLGGAEMCFWYDVLLCYVCVALGLTLES